LPAVRATDDWSYRGFRAVILENEFLRVSTFPELGSKIYDVTYLPNQTGVLWHNPRIPLRKTPFGSKFDDAWAGGWDEIFPNDQESVVGGEKYPDMGEAWSLEWDYSIRDQRNSASVTTSVMTPITPASITRRLTLEKGARSFRCEYEIENLSGDQIKFIWKVHPAFEVNSRCTIQVPAERALVDPRFQHLFEDPSYDWPFAELRGRGNLDMSRVDPNAGLCTCQYLIGLDEGRVRFRDELRGLQSTLTFPKEVFNNVWLFLDYGGWRSSYIAAIEPSTGYPHDLAESIRRGRCTTLDGHSRISALVEFSVEPIGSNS
jgi:hypothetical protein